MYRCQSLLVFLTIIASISGHALAAEVLSELPSNVQEDIKTVCLPVQYQEGAQSYRQCVINEINAYTGVASVPVSSLSFDDKYAVQQACARAGKEGSSTHRICVRQQIAELNALPLPVIDDLSDDEQYALQQTCFEAQTRLGAGPYRRCVNRALTELRQMPKANFTGLSQVAQNGIQLRCSANHQNVIDYRECLIEAVGGVTATTAAAKTIITQQREPAENKTVSSAQSPTAPKPTAAKQSIDESTQGTTIASTNNGAIIEVDTPEVKAEGSTTLANGDLIKALPSQQATVLTDLVDAPANDVTSASDSSTVGNLDSDADDSGSQEGSSFDLRGRAIEAWEQLKSTLLSLEGINRILVLAALALPALLILGWALLRNRRGSQTTYEPAPRNTDLLNRIHPEFQSAEHERYKNRLDAEADEFFSTIDASGIYEEEPNPGSPVKTNGQSNPDTQAKTQPVDSWEWSGKLENLDDTLERPVERSREDTSTDSSTEDADTSEAPTRIATKPEIAAAAEAQQRLSDFDDLAPEINAADRGSFSAWLNASDPDDQLSYAIEFLVYWLAYGDERYDPALKEVLFQLQDPDDHDLIKRWVLKKDALAFRDTISWLQNNTNFEQRQQIIDLLMVLLINERALTPVQNTLLRFLSDAFGIGNAALDKRFREAYGTAMAPLPRVDKPKWWQRQDESASFRWDARSVADESLDLQYRVRLGLDLEGDIDEESVVKGFRRAARRCHPDHFDALTDRERDLAEMQFEKFEDARDYLLGVGA